MMAFRSVTASSRVGKVMLRSYMRPGACCSVFNVHSAKHLTNSQNNNNNNSSGSSNIDDHSRVEIPPSVEGYQGGEHEFTHNQSLEVLSAAVEYHYSDRTKSGVSEPVQVKTEGPTHKPEDDSPHDYDNSGHVSLSSCMQTNVPEPFHASGRSPVHLNMPRQGRNMSEQKYVASKLENIHPSRQFSTSVMQYGGTKPITESLVEYEAVPCPQGVQGDDCVQFQLWLETCRRYGLSNCEDQLQGIQSGRKTLAQVLAEQEALIREIAEEYKASALANDSPAPFQELDIDGVCPQGVQGEDCERFKLWLKNCQQFGFKNCTEQLQGVQGGKKTLGQIFQEQEDMIRNISKRFCSTSTGSRDWKVGKGSGSRTLNTDLRSTQSPAPAENLSQKDRLKRAMKDYGATVVVFHVGISLISLGGFYLLVSSGLDVVGMLSKLGVGQSFLQSQVLTGASTFVISYAVHKVFAPVRIAITLTSTPFIVRHLRKIGFLKPAKAVNK